MTLTPEQLTPYEKGYYAGWRRATIAHLGGKCVECEETDPYKLEIHHRNGLARQSRQVSDLMNLSELEIRCKEHHNK